MQGLSWKDLFVFIIFPILGYGAFALYKINGNMSKFFGKMDAWVTGHEKLDDERHKDLVERLK